MPYNPLVRKKTFKKSRWVSLQEKEIKFKNQRIEKYHSLDVHDYVVILATTPSNKVPIVRQYRPAVEKMTWEFPAGLIDAKMSPKNIAVQELREEALLKVNKITKLGETFADPGRLSCRVHSFFAECEERDLGAITEENISLKFVNKNELISMIVKNQIFSMHVSLIAYGILKKIKWFDDF